MNSMNQYCLLIISKYFNTIQDYVNLVKTCKEFKDIIKQYRFNPIELDENELKIFENIEEYHFYSKTNSLISIPNIKKYIHWIDKITYLDYLTIQENHEYKNVILTKDDVKYLKPSQPIYSLNIGTGITEIEKGCFKTCT